MNILFIFYINIVNISNQHSYFGNRKSWIRICISPYGFGSDCYYPNPDTRIQIPITEFDTDSVSEHTHKKHLKNIKYLLLLYFSQEREIIN